MEYTALGDTGLQVSRLCLGCMNFGTATSEKYAWSLPENRSREIIERAIDLGITSFDTSNSYSWGDSERVLGRALEGYNRDRLVVATKVFYRMDDANPNSGGLSRKAIEQELAHSLERLGLDTIDLYQIHRWDETTPIQETLRTLTDAVRRGDVHYIGASTMRATQFATALSISDRLGGERFVSMQPQYNLVYRERERELLPFCREEGIGVLPWSPLANGFLARPHDRLATTERGRTDDWLEERPYKRPSGYAINDRVAELAEEYGVSMAQIALAWLLAKDWVDAPIVGVSSVKHLEDAVAALDLDLTRSDVAYLEEPYRPTAVYLPRTDTHATG